MKAQFSPIAHSRQSQDLSRSLGESSSSQASQFPVRNEVNAVPDSSIAECPDTARDQTFASVIPPPSTMNASSPLQPLLSDNQMLSDPSVSEFSKFRARDLFVSHSSTIGSQFPPVCVHPCPQAPTSSDKLSRDLFKYKSMQREWIDLLKKLHLSFGEFDEDPPAPATDSVGFSISYYKQLVYRELTRLSLLEANCYLDDSAKSASEEQKK